MEKTQQIAQEVQDDRRQSFSKFSSLRQKMIKEMKIVGHKEHIKNHQAQNTQTISDVQYNGNLKVGSPNINSTQKNIFTYEKLNLNNKKEHLKMQLFKKKNIQNTKNDNISFKSEFHNKYEILDGLLGEGAHGQVKKCRLKKKNSKLGLTNNPQEEQKLNEIVENYKKKQKIINQSDIDENNNKSNIKSDFQIQYSQDNKPKQLVRFKKPSIICSQDDEEDENKQMKQELSIMQSIKNSIIYAVKIIRSEDEEIIISIQQTFKLQKLLNSQPYIGKVYELFIDTQNNYIYQVMEYVEWPSLRQIMSQKKQISEEDTKKITKSLCESVYNMHIRGICHRDLKPDNIMINPDDYSQIKIIDFGIARKFVQQHDKYNSKKNDMWTMTGTPHYKAPEMFHFGYSELVDVWAIGVIVYEMLSGQLPFDAELQHDLIDEIQKCDLQFKVIENSVTGFQWNSNLGLAKDFVKRLVCKIQGKHTRLSAECAKNHLWISSQQKGLNDTLDDISVKNENNMYNKNDESDNVVLQMINKQSQIQTPTLKKYKMSKFQKKQAKKLQSKLYLNTKNEQEINEEDESSDENQEVRIRTKTRTLLADFIADNQDKDVHKSQLQSPSSSLSLATLNDRIKMKKNTVRLQKSPKPSNSFGDLSTEQQEKPLLRNNQSCEMDNNNNYDDLDEADSNSKQFVFSSNEDISSVRQKKILKKSQFSPSAQPTNYSDQIEEINLNDSCTKKSNKSNFIKNNDNNNNQDNTENKDKPSNGISDSDSQSETNNLRNQELGSDSDCDSSSQPKSDEENTNNKVENNKVSQNLQQNVFNVSFKINQNKQINNENNNNNSNDILDQNQEILDKSEYYDNIKINNNNIKI